MIAWAARLAATVVLIAAGAAAVAPAAYAAPRQAYLAGDFSQRTMDRFTRDLAKVGIGVYRPGSRRPVRRLRGPRSPMRLSADQARTAALGAHARMGLSGATLDTLTRPVRLSRKVSLPIGAAVAGWTRRVRSPSARLARRILGRQDWDAYRTVVFPSAVTMLFASDLALHLPRRGGRRRAPARASAAAAAGPCTSALGFIDDTINDVFDSIGRLSTDREAIRGFVRDEWLSEFIIGVGNTVSDAANFVVDRGRQIVLSGTRIPIKLVTNSIAALAGTVSVISNVANAIAPWSARVDAAPGRLDRAVGVGVPGKFILTATAFGGERQWPVSLVDCAGVFNFPLPTLTPKGADVKWDVSYQDPLGLIVSGSDSGPLNDRGKAELSFLTTPETAEEATGDWNTGVVHAIAKVHRRDLEGLQEDLVDRLFGTLPDAVRKAAGAQLRSILVPRIKKLTEKATKIMDVQAVGILAVRYHTPKDPKSKPGKDGPLLPLPAPCKLVTQAEARKAAGSPVQPGQTVPADLNPLGSGLACVFRDVNSPSGDFGYAFVRINAVDLRNGAATKFSAYKATFAPVKSGEVPGLGDDNFYIRAPEGSTNLYVRRQNIALLVSVLTGDGLNQATALARTALKRF